MKLFRKVVMVFKIIRTVNLMDSTIVKAEITKMVQIGNSVHLKTVQIGNLTDLKIVQIGDLTNPKLFQIGDFVDTKMLKFGNM